MVRWRSRFRGHSQRASTDFIGLADAALECGVNRNKPWGVVKDGTLKAYDGSRDKRVTLLSRRELDDFFQVRVKEGREVMESLNGASRIQFSRTNDAGCIVHYRAT